MAELGKTPLDTLAMSSSLKDLPLTEIASDPIHDDDDCHEYEVPCDAPAQFRTRAFTTSTAITVGTKASKFKITLAESGMFQSSLEDFYHRMHCAPPPVGGLGPMPSYLRRDCITTANIGGSIHDVVLRCMASQLYVYVSKSCSISIPLAALVKAVDQFKKGFRWTTLNAAKKKWMAKPLFLGCYVPCEIEARKSFLDLCGLKFQDKTTCSGWGLVSSVPNCPAEESLDFVLQGHTVNVDLGYATFTVALCKDGLFLIYNDMIVPIAVPRSIVKSNVFFLPTFPITFV
jgi:hypothetical protein